MFEKLLIEHCSCTLAAIKCASLFNFKYENEEELLTKIDYYNKLFVNKDLELFILKKNNGRALVFVVRNKLLKNTLKDKNVQQFLKKFGYANFKVNKVIDVLTKRIEGKEFPHEIGVLLGYPLNDVCGFINNCGRNCKHIGCWKVYCDVDESLKMFRRFSQCNKAYKLMYSNGKSVLDLVVSYTL